jgi:hypothetical protein
MPSGGTPSAKDTLETYLDMLSIIYKQVTYDLGSNFDPPLWRNFMGRLGSMVRSVPGDAHWPNAAEKPVELVRTESPVPGTVFQICIFVPHSKLLFVI